MKGQIEQVGWTAIVFVFFVIVTVVAFAHYLIIQLPWGPGTIKYSVEFADFANKPYIFGEVLTHYVIEDRQLMEHCLESVIVDSLERAKSENVTEKLADMVDDYGFDYQIMLLPEAATTVDDILLSIGKERGGYGKAVIPLLYKSKIGFLVVETK